MSLLLVLISILVVWSVNLKGASDGLAVYLKPDFSKMSDKQIWIDAFSQIFFTLSLGFGIMIAYASYLSQKSQYCQRCPDYHFRELSLFHFCRFRGVWNARIHGAHDGATGFRSGQ